MFDFSQLLGKAPDLLQLWNIIDKDLTKGNHHIT